MADLYKVATGWLGWPPHTALTTPIPQILLAREGLIDWNRVLWGGEKPTKDKAPVGDRIKAAFRAMGARRPEAPPADAAPAGVAPSGATDRVAPGKG